MISLPEFIKNKQKHQLDSNWSRPLDIQSSEYTFEDHCKRFTINMSNYNEQDQKIIWENYINGLWVPYDFELDGYDYSTFLLEMEMNVKDSEYVLNELNSKYSEYFENYKAIDNGLPKFVFYRLYGDENKLLKLLENKDYEHCMNFCNWATYPYYEDDHLLYLLVKPNKTEDITEIVYENEFIYHYCPKFIYEDRIKKWGLNPKHKFGSKYEKLFCFSSSGKIDKKKLAQQIRLKLRRIDNPYKKYKSEKGFVLLKLDLSKDQKQITFYQDEESNSRTAFYTFEPIAPYCIVDTEDIEI